jgi:inosose dehydratase
VKIGCSGITWCSFARQQGTEIPQEQILSEIAQAGYQGAPFNARDERPADEIVAGFAQFGLEPAPSYLGARFWDEHREEEIVAQAREAARLSQQVGCSELYVAASPLTRREASGHVREEDALAAEAYRQFAYTLNRVGEVCLSYGVRIGFHNHVGSVIETRQEIDRLFHLVDRDLVYQGPDIGHLAWAGDDVVQFCRDYADSIVSLHVKDIDPQVMAEGAAREWDYDAFSRQGIFAELGEGMVDLPAVFDVLQRAGYEGWVIVETDVTQKETPLQSAAISRAYLKSIGL